ncbi:hypothetical protein HZB89_02080, partial [archaeon]|nr:hypothetical protein [archaeon]
MKLFCLLDGLHPEMAFAELQAIIEAEGIKPKAIQKEKNLAVIECNGKNLASLVSTKAGLTRFIAEFIF